MRGKLEAVELPRRAELAHHPRGRHAGAVLPHVFGSHDWGVVGQPRFDRRQLLDMKGTASRTAFPPSTTISRTATTIARHPMDTQTGPPRISGDYGKL